MPHASAVTGQGGPVRGGLLKSRWLKEILEVEVPGREPTAQNQRMVWSRKLLTPGNTGLLLCPLLPSMPLLLTFLYTHYQLIHS